MLNFDPRQPEDRAVTRDQCIQHLTKLAAVCPNNSLSYLWDTTPVPPEFTSEVEVATTLRVEEQVAQLILQRNSISARVLDQFVKPEVLHHIEMETRSQADSELWHKLHNGRLTSSNFGAIFRAKNAPSLINKILDNR
jgi:hypothetical protein